MVYVIQSTVDSYSLDFQGVLCMGMDLTYFENLFGGMSFHVALYNEVGDLLYSDLPEAAQTIETHEKLADLFDPEKNGRWSVFLPSRKSFPLSTR